MRTGTVSRRKAFEGLYYEGTCLPDDVVLRLDQDPEFRGIASFSMSSFWFLLGKPLNTAHEATSFVDQGLASLGLKRLSVCEEEAIEASNEPDRPWKSLDEIVRMEQWRFIPPGASPADLSHEELSALCKASRSINLDVIALLGGLYRELYLTFELEDATRVGTAFWMLLEEFTASDDFSTIDGDFLHYCVSRILYGRSDAEATRSFTAFDPVRLPGKPIGLFMPLSD